MRLITRAAYAKQLDLSYAMVYRNFQKGNRLAHALVGDRVNMDDPEVLRFSAEYNLDSSKDPMQETGVSAYPRTNRLGAQAKRKTPAVPVPDPQPPPNIPTAPAPAPAPANIPSPKTDPQNIDDYMDWTLREIASKHGAAPLFKDYMLAVKNLEQILTLKSERSRKEGDYILREHAQKLISHVEGLHVALLSDCVISMRSTVRAQVEAHSTDAEIEKSMSAIISRTVKGAKSALARVLKNA